MGSFGGHVIPATLLFVYGFFLSLHSMHTHHLLSHPTLNAYIYPPSASKLLSSHAAPHLPGLSRLLLNRRVQNIAYVCAILLAATHASIELILWDGMWMHMTPLQHSTMYFLVVLCALIGLGMDTGMLPYTARYIVGICFWLCGFMFYSHAQEGLYNESIHKVRETHTDITVPPSTLCQYRRLILSELYAVCAMFNHQMVAYLFWAAGSIYIVYSMLLASCFFSAARIGSAGVTSESHVISPVLLAFTSTFARLTSLFIMLAGSWLFHIAFAMYSPFVEDDIVHPDHDAHTLYLELSWHFLTITTIGLFIEAFFRQQTGEWGQGNVRRVRYERVNGGKSVSDDGWLAGAAKFTVDGEEEERTAVAEAGRSKRDGKVRKATNGATAAGRVEKRAMAPADDAVLIDEDGEGEYDI